MLKKLATQVAALVLCAVVTFSQIGCTSQATIAELTGVLGNAASSIAALENNPTLAAKLKTDTAAAQSAITNWKTGTPASEAIEALNLVEDDLNLIPVASQYTALIDLAIGTVESILALLPQPAATPSAARARVQRRSVPRTSIKTAKEFRKAWNAPGIPGQPFI